MNSAIHQEKTVSVKHRLSDRALASQRLLHESFWSPMWCGE